MADPLTRRAFFMSLIAVGVAAGLPLPTGMAALAEIPVVMKLSKDWVLHKVVKIGIKYEVVAGADKSTLACLEKAKPTKPQRALMVFRRV